MTSLLALLLVAVAVAADDETDGPAGRSLAEIKAQLADKNAKYKLDKIEAEFEASEHPVAPTDVYELLDLGATPAMTRLAASRAQLFWNGREQALGEVIAAGRASAPEHTVQVASNADLVMVFEEFNDITYGKKTAEEAVGSLAPRKDYEDDAKFAMRAREHALKLAAARSPWEGRIDRLTFAATLQGTFTEHDGRCTSAVVRIDLSQVSLELFRATLGGRRVEAELKLGETNVQSAKFSAAGTYRFEATSKPICVSAAQAHTLLQQGARLELTFRRPHDSDDWTGSGAFTNAKTGARL